MSFVINDRVKIIVPKENREWGYNPCPDNSEGIIQSFSEITTSRVNCYPVHPPGVYENRYWMNIKLDSGELINIGEHCVREIDPLIDKRPYIEGKFLRPLPDLFLWEGDIVTTNPGGWLSRYSELMIVNIEYDHISWVRDDGSMFPIYLVSESFDFGWHTCLDKNQLTFVRRGNVWKFYHNEPIVWDSLEDECNFHMRIGKTEEVRNPKNSLYIWELDDALDAIEDGTVDGFKMGGFFSIKKIRAHKFLDPELGSRVRKDTLKGFSR